MPSKATALEPIPSSVAKTLTTHLKEVDSLQITNAEEMAEATTILSNLNKFSDSITEEKEKVTKPLNDALKAERGRWKPTETKLEEAISSIRGKMTKYQTEMVKKQQEEEQKIVNRVGEGKGKYSTTTAVRKLSEVDTAQNKVQTDAGSIQFMTVKKFEVTDLSKVPLEYLILDEVKVRTDVKKGIEIPGIRAFEEQVPKNFR